MAPVAPRYNALSVNSVPWTAEHIAKLKKERAPLRRNKWNDWVEAMSSPVFLIPWAAWFFFALFSHYTLEKGFGLGVETATDIALGMITLWFIPIVLFPLFTSNMGKRPQWIRMSLAEFYKRFGEIAATPFFQKEIQGLSNISPIMGIPTGAITTAYEVECCLDARTVIIWKSKFKIVTGPPPYEIVRLEYQEDVPVSVFDLAEMRML